MKPLDQRKKDFIDDMKDELETLDQKYQNKKFLNRFYLHWTEHVKNVTANTRMRFEQKRHHPFNVRRRMITFFHNYGTEQWQESKNVKSKEQVYKPPQKTESDYVPSIDYEKAKQRLSENKIVGNIGEKVKQQLNK